MNALRAMDGKAPYPFAACWGKKKARAGIQTQAVFGLNNTVDIREITEGLCSEILGEQSFVDTDWRDGDPRRVSLVVRGTEAEVDEVCTALKAKGEARDWKTCDDSEDD